MNGARWLGSIGLATFALVLAACKLGLATGGGSEGGGGSGEGGRSSSSSSSSGGVTPLSLWQLAAGGDNTCLRSPLGHVACWGSNEVGQLGLGDFQDRYEPTWIPGLDSVIEIAVGDFAMCALRADGSVWCWGMNAYGQLSAKTEDCPWLGYGCSPVPVKAAVTGAHHLVAGSHHFCALVGPENALECWGMAPGLETQGALDVATGYWHSCIRFQPGPGEDPNRNVICDGHNDTGQLGIGSTDIVAATPVIAGPAGGFVELAAGLDFTCGVGADQSLRCWGQNVFACLGVGVSEDYYPENCWNSGSCSTTPVPVPSLSGVAHVAVGFAHACAITTDGAAHCWGTPSHTSPASAGACWMPTPECAPTPQLVPGVTGAAAIALGYGHACTMGSGGEVMCWGLDTHGQLGRGEPPALSFDPTPVVVSVPQEP